MKYPPLIIGVGRNYKAHADEMYSDTGVIFFTKNPASVISSGEEILIPKCCGEESQVDYEGELAVRIGETCLNVSEADAMEFIDGYAVANDVTERAWQKQRNGGQWVRGKGFNTFCPLSSFVSPSSIADPHSLSLTTTLNGEIVQADNTSSMIYSIAKLISLISTDTTIPKGTILLTGTPSGVGFACDPQRFLQEGDLIEVEIEGVGQVSNTVASIK
jgi:2-keto-4-pentenoate hydratase/2-oxohepta-3-ene-1,7-dioic acid hydratase in catechol pathway|tara:strand:- start:502 stop:1152 length:651 start_codon:yes stop_codon:yes gene_type:complete